MTNKVEWFWTEKHSERAQGPFESKEKAIEDARASLKKGSVIEVGKVKRIEPEHYLPDQEDIIERMEEGAVFEDFGWVDEDEIIDVKPGADKALREFMLQWSREYLSIDRWLADDPDAEIVILD